MNLLSAVCTAAAGGVMAFIIAREWCDERDRGWAAIASGLLAGLMCSVWANATESEVYALALLHVVAMFAAAARAGDEPRDDRWLLVTAWLVALAPAVHLSALVGAPAAVALAARSRTGDWRVERVVLLGGVVIATAGVGRLSAPLVVAGCVVQGIGWWLAPGVHGRRGVARLLLVPLAVSALLLLLVRARHDPSINQGVPTTLSALGDVVGRRQYAVAGLLPRQAPVWLQLANVAQYADWQVAMGWGRGIFTTPARVVATLVYVALGVIGWRGMRREVPRLATALVVLVASGSLGVAAYLNMRAGASLGWELLGDAPHEARERDYFFVLAFWGWACLAGSGALMLARRFARPWLALLAAAVPLVANWHVADRSSGPDADGARRFAAALLVAAPRGAVLFTSGDNDSYPLWYLQQVEGARPDVQLVTLPLLPAEWYARQVGERTGWRWRVPATLPGALWRHELVAFAIARAAHDARRPVAVSPALTARERDMLGADWVLRGPLFLAHAPARGASAAAPDVDSLAAARFLAAAPVAGRRDRRLPDDVAPEVLALLECPRLGLPWRGTPAGRDSLEVRCNFR
jgi:Protein of unknown function (DUF2723)